MMSLKLPSRKKGRRSKEDSIIYETDLKNLANAIIQLQLKIAKRSSLDRIKEDEKISSRGWCYLLEVYHIITKDQFDICQKIINECRKKGYIPIDFVALDKSRLFDHVEVIDKYYSTPYEYLKSWFSAVRNCNTRKDDISFWESQKVYIQIMVEKIDVKNIFNNICKKYHIPIANAKGWSDLNGRYEMAMRFKIAEDKGLQPILLYYGDFDPAGLNIAKQLKKNIFDIEQATKWSPKNLIVDHFGLTYEFIEKHNLLWIDNLITGSKTKKDLSNPKHADHNKEYVQTYIKKYGVRKCEANAILIIKEKAIEELETKLLNYLGDDPFKIYDKKIKKEQNDVLKIMEKSEIRELLDIINNNLEAINDNDYEARAKITKKQWLSIKEYVIANINDMYGNDDDIPLLKEILRYIYDEFVIQDNLYDNK